jgi:hypothetical protein
VATSRIIFGRVVDASTGGPIVGASVSVLPRGDDGETDAQGVFEIQGWHGDLVRCAVRVAGVGTALGPWLPFETGDRLDAGTLRIEARPRIAGRVVDPSGAPVAAADVRLEREGPVSEEWETLLGEFGYQTTEDDGRFSFEGLDDGFFRLSVSVYDAVANDDPRRTKEHVRAGEEIVFVVQSPHKPIHGTLAVTVTLPDGRLLPSGLLHVASPVSRGSMLISEGRGVVTFDTALPTTICVACPRDENGVPLPYRPQFLRDVVPREEPYAIVLKPGETIDGVVTSADGMPVKAVVSLVPSGLDDVAALRDISIECGDDGRFRSPGLVPGEYRLLAACNGYFGVRPWVTARAGATGVTIEMRRAARIQLRVVAPEGQALDGGTFTLLTPGPAGYTEGGTAAVSAGRNSMSQFFEIPFDGLREGEVYRVRGSVSGRGVGRYAPFEIDAVAGDGKPVEVKLSPGRTLAGRVVREGGAPVAAAQVRVRVPLPSGQDETAHWSADHGQANAFSGHDGRFELRGVPDSAFWLTCAAPGLAEKMALNVGSHERDIEIVLAPALEISGHIAGDAPLDFRIDWVPTDLAGEAVAIQRELVHSGADGFFAIRGLPKGTLRLDGWRPWDEDDDRYVQAEGVEAGASDLRLRVVAGARIEGTVKDRDGEPLHMAAVVVEAPWGTRRTTTDAEGRFVLRALPPGRHAVRVRTAQGLGEPTPVDAPGPPVHLTR